MRNNSSLKCLNLIRRSQSRLLPRVSTPMQAKSPSKPKVFEIRSPSPEAAVKLKSTITMYERMKFSLTPKRSPPRTPSQSQPKLKPIAIRSPNKHEITKLSIKEYGVGDEYAKAFSLSVKKLLNLKELNIRNNRIADKGACSILTSLNRSNMRVLDISNNRIGESAVKALVEILSSFSAGIEKLSLENTHLSLVGFREIVGALKNNRSLKELNLASNRLGVGCGELLKELAIQTSTLKKLDLHWNHVKSAEAVLFFQGLKFNDTLEELDMSWNALGSELPAIAALCSYLESESQLRHLDISNNRITYESCILINQAIKVNRNLIGLHIEGNYGSIDHLGFVSAVSSIEISLCLQKSARILRTPKRINNNKCWICNTYTDFDISWNPNAIVWSEPYRELFETQSITSTQPVFVHLELDRYQPYLLAKNEVNSYFATRAIPRGKKVYFFFSYCGQPQVSTDYTIETVDTIDLSLTSETGEVKISTSVVNSTCVYDSQLNCKPRPALSRFFVEPYEENPAAGEWKIENSIFNNYSWDSDEVLNDCFEFDWANCKVSRMVKSDATRSTIKELVRPYYKHIRKAYKLYAALGTNGNFFSINLAMLTEICQKCEIFDKGFKISDVDLALKASKFSQSNVSSAYGLVRHEFLEFVIRIALDKYHRSGLFKSEKEAVQAFFSRNFNNIIDLYDPSRWRNDRFFNKRCEEVILSNRELFEALFEVYNGKRAKPGEQKYMLVEDFINFCQSYGVFTEVFNLRQATLCFHMALSTFTDEINSISHMKAHLQEFIEAFSRVVDFIDSNDPEKDMLASTYSKTPLDAKLSSLLLNRFSGTQLLKPAKPRATITKLF